MRIKRNERLVYILEAIFAVAILVFALFLFNLHPSIRGYYLVAVLGILLTASICFFGYHRDKHYLKSFVSRLVVSCLLLTAIVCFALGLLLGFTHSSFSLDIGDILSKFLPILLISVETELLRYVIFHSYYRHRIPVVIFTTIAILMNIIFALDVSSFASAEAIFITICTVFLPIIATELLCSYLCAKVGLQPALIYKLTVRLYPFILPILPNLGHFIYAVVAIVLPAAIFLFTYNLNLTNRKDQKRIRRRNQLIISVPIGAFLLLIVVLVTGIFKHQIIAIASDSMTPTFVRGDAVMVEKCGPEEIKENDILVFKHEHIIVTHRVTQIDIKNDQYLFTTKGDHNDKEDAFKTKESQVVGRVVMVYKYIGLPTVWLSELFKAE